MKILHLCPSFNNPIYAHLCDELIKQNVDCSVFSFISKNSKLSVVQRDYCCYEKPFNNFDRFFFFLKERKIIKHLLSKYDPNGFQLIHAHTLFTSGFVAYKMNKKYNVPYLVAVRSTDVDLFFKYRFYLRQIGKMILKKAKQIVFISPSIKKRLFDCYLSNKEKEILAPKCVVIPNGIDDFWFSNSEALVKTPNNSFVYYGDINSNKNVVTSCKALELFAKKTGDVAFYVIGPVQDKKVFEEIKKYPFVYYHEPLSKEQLLPFLKKASVFLMPSLRETFGLSYIEAMTQGLPIIFSKNQGPDGFFRDNSVGFSVEPFSSKDIMEKIESIMCNYSAISENCFKESQQFKWSGIAKKYKRIYLEAINNDI